MNLISIQHWKVKFTLNFVQVLKILKVVELFLQRSSVDDGFISECNIESNCIFYGDNFRQNCATQLKRFWL